MLMFQIVLAKWVTMNIKLDTHQLVAINNLRTGSILNGGVGSGKSRTAIAYYFMEVCKGELEINNRGQYHIMRKPLDLYIITTARKRDTRVGRRVSTIYVNH